MYTPTLVLDPDVATADERPDADLPAPGRHPLVAIDCSCGCGCHVLVDPTLLDPNYEGRVKCQFRPLCYCEDHADFVVSGSTGYIYATRWCLNAMNDE